jgi:enamine deaminase RidA (YjgF/YER057c/UK114 family)
MVMPEGAATQTRNALETIKKALGDADSCLEDVVRGRYYLANSDDVDEVFAVLGEYFGDIRPAATMVICGLVSPDMLVEIEVTAQKQS